MNFVAIDFETANSYRKSACSLGLVIVENGQIVDEKYWLIRPVPFEVGQMQYSIHRIGIEQLADKPTFAELWPELRPYLENKTVVAHNASFDIGVLTQALEHFELSPPALEFQCTVRLAKQIWREEIMYKLGWLAYKQGLDLQHHNALSDARTCANLVLKMAEHSGHNDVRNLFVKHGVPLRPLEDFGNRQSGSGGSYPKKQASALVPETTNIDPEHIFYGKQIAFTGTLGFCPRIVAQQLVVNVGGIPLDGITSKTNYLVLGEQDFERYGEGHKSGKLKKAEKYIRDGCDLEIIDEAYFQTLVL